LGTRREFLLGRWLDRAKNWATDDDTRRHYEWNARTQITLWGPREGVLHDYARKSWSGLIAGFYRPRWVMFFDALKEAMTTGNAFDGAAFDKACAGWEETWTHGTEPYASEPSGVTLDVAREAGAVMETLFDSMLKPEVVSLTTGKPVSCASFLPEFPAYLANDGRISDTASFWGTDISRGDNPWWQVDLEKPETVGRIVVVGFYGDDRYYGFTVETSVDGTTWEMAADRRGNREPATRAGYTCVFGPRQARYIRVTQTVNSANTGRHLVEVLAYQE